MADFTRSAIKSSLSRLLDERPLSKITVKDIAADCGINRNTFYYHYQSIPELITEMINDEAKRIVESHPKPETLEDCLETIAQTALDRKRSILHIYHSTNRDLYEQYLWNICAHLMEILLNTVLNGRILPQSDWAVIHNYYVCLCYGYLSQWINSGMQEDILPNLRRINTLQHGMLDTMIARSLDQNP